MIGKIRRRTVDLQCVSLSDGQLAAIPETSHETWDHIVQSRADTPGVHGVAIADTLGRGYVSAGATANIVVFDLKSLARIGEIKTTGENPDAILYEPKTQRVFTFNGRGRNVTAVDARKNEVVGTAERLERGTARPVA
jgi:DNA-binding beta-propeller fold protein YncE